MNDSEKISRRLVEALLQYCDIDTENLGEEDKVLVSIDGKAMFLIHIEGRLIHFTGFLDQAAKTENFYLGLLQENFKSCSGMRGHRYAIDPETGELILSLTIRTDDVSQSDFIDEFEQFVTFSERWLRSLLAGSEETLSAVPSADKEPDRKFSGERADFVLIRA